MIMATLRAPREAGPGQHSVGNRSSVNRLSMRRGAGAVINPQDPPATAVLRLTIDTSWVISNSAS